jgi:diguanylate cyclase (GGDEF)-like protein/PAS domain S-box-containing protein
MASSSTGALKDPLAGVCAVDIPALRANESNFRTLFDTIPHGVVFHAVDGQITTANAAAQHILGLTLDQLRGKTPIDPRWKARRLDGNTIPGEEHPAMLALKSGKVVQDTLMEIDVPERSRIWIQVNAVPLFHDGVLSGAYASFDDITVRKRLQEELHISQQRFRSFVENANDVYFALNPAGDFTYVSPRWCEVFGYELNETLGRPFIPFVHPEDIPTCLQALQETMTTGRKRGGVEYRVKRNDGSYVWYAANVSLIDDPASGKPMLIGIGRDISERKYAEQALQESEARYRTLLEWSPEPCAVHRNGLLVYVNPATLELFGVPSLEQVIGSPLMNWVHPDCRELAKERIKALATVGLTNMAVEEKFLKMDGSVISVEVKSTAIQYDGEKAIYVVIHDITQRKRADLIAKQYQTVIQTSMDGFWITDETATIIEVNEAVCSMHGYTQSELLGLNITDLEADESSEETAAHTEQMRDSGYVQFEARHRRKDGTVINVEVSVQYSAELGGRMFAFVRDITERKILEEKVHQLAFNDPLTNLPNRRLLGDRLRQTISACKRSLQFAALLFIDLDNFKPLNDRHGHDAGDLLLVQVAKRISDCVRQVDTVARFGGDEFVVILTAIDEHTGRPRDQAHAVAQKILYALALPYKLTLHDDVGEASTLNCGCTASIGITLIAHDASSPEDVLRSADTAMYRAKHDGGSSIWFSD